jgi:hypothetical protein
MKDDQFLPSLRKILQLKKTMELGQFSLYHIKIFLTIFILFKHNKSKGSLLTLFTNYVPYVHIIHTQEQ